MTDARTTTREVQVGTETTGEMVKETLEEIPVQKVDGEEIATKGRTTDRVDEMAFRTETDHKVVNPVTTPEGGNHSETDVPKDHRKVKEVQHQEEPR